MWGGFCFVFTFLVQIFLSKEFHFLCLSLTCDDRITKLRLVFLPQVRVNKEQDHVLISPQGLSYAEVTGTNLVSNPLCCRGNTGNN